MKKNKIVRIILAIVSILAVIILECISPSKFVFVKSILLLFNFVLVLTLTKGEKYNALRILLLTILYLGIFSWFLPAAAFQTELSKEGLSQIGLFDLLSNYFATSIQYFGTFALFILVVGGFYGVLHMIPGYRSLLDKHVRILEGNEKLFVCVTIIVLSVLTSVCGVQMALLIFFPFIASIILLLGYDKIVAALALVGSTMVGVIGTTIGSANTSYLVEYLAGSEKVVNFNTEIVTRTAILLIGIILLIIATLRYIKKSATVKGGVAAKSTIKAGDEPVIVSEIKGSKTVKKTTKKTTKTRKTTKSKNHNKADARDTDVIVVKEDYGTTGDIVPGKVNGKHSSLPIFIAFICMFVIFVLAFIPWSTTLGTNAFDSATKAVTDFKIFGFPIFGKILGTTNAFGVWTVTDLIPLLMIVIIILGLIYRVKVVDFVEGFINGVKKAVIPAGVVILIYVGLVIVTFHNYQLSMYVSIFDLFGGKFDIVGTSIVTILSGFFNSDPTYSFNAVVPYFMSIVTDTASYGKVFVLMTSMYGLAMLFVPTSIILMVVLTYLRVPFGTWFKKIWLLLVALFIALILILLIWSPIFTWILVGLLVVLLIVLLALKKI